MNPVVLPPSDPDAVGARRRHALPRPPVLYNQKDLAHPARSYPEASDSRLPTKKGLLHMQQPLFSSVSYLNILMNTIRIPELQKSTNMAPTSGTAKNARGAGP